MWYALGPAFAPGVVGMLECESRERNHNCCVVQTSHVIYLSFLVLALGRSPYPWFCLCYTRNDQCGLLLLLRDNNPAPLVSGCLCGERLLPTTFADSGGGEGPKINGRRRLVPFWSESGHLSSLSCLSLPRPPFLRSGLFLASIANAFVVSVFLWCCKTKTCCCSLLQNNGKWIARPEPALHCCW